MLTTAAGGGCYDIRGTSQVRCVFTSNFYGKVCRQRQAEENALPGEKGYIGQSAKHQTIESYQSPGV